MTDLTPADYDALYVAVEEDMPRIPRGTFSLVLDQLIRAGELRMSAS